MPERDPATHLRHAFVRDGRLTSLPSRRLLVDESFLERADGEYWRRE